MVILKKSGFIQVKRICKTMQKKSSTWSFWNSKRLCFQQHHSFKNQRFVTSKHVIKYFKKPHYLSNTLNIESRQGLNLFPPKSWFCMPMVYKTAISQCHGFLKLATSKCGLSIVAFLTHEYMEIPNYWKIRALTPIEFILLLILAIKQRAQNPRFRQNQSSFSLSVWISRILEVKFIVSNYSYGFEINFLKFTHKPIPNSSKIVEFI